MCSPIADSYRNGCSAVFPGTPRRASSTKLLPLLDSAFVPTSSSPWSLTTGTMYPRSVCTRTQHGRLAHFRRHVTTGIITDGYLVAQKRKIAALGLEQLVDHIVYSDEFGRDHWKPSSVPYLMMMKMIGCTGPDCSYVSDNPMKDFVTAKALGWTTVRIRRIGGEYSEVVVDATHSAHYEFSTLDDLTKALVI